MVTESAEPAFYGNVGVTLHVPDSDDQSRTVDVVIPPDRVEVKIFSHNAWDIVYEQGFIILSFIAIAPRFGSQIV